MRNLGPVGSFTESHRAKGSHPDRRFFYPKPDDFRPQRIFQDGFAVELDEELRHGFFVRYDNGQTAEVSRAFIRELPPKK